MKTKTIMGVDFGVANIMYIAFNNNYYHYSFVSAPVIKKGRKLIKTGENPYEILDRYNYNIALKVLYIAIKHQVRTIHMEDLTGTSFTNNMFYYELQRGIQTLAQDKNIKVRYVNRHMTSQKCSLCGYIDKRNRINRKTFICLKCGNTMNADYNAAKNIANPNIQSIKTSSPL
ncbi:zinc ribbon domain-containing protein [Clostridium sp. BNL1100]|uniref:zinc ribbon domain-containing protein n=1 Tax=Clostridium sp. BNL1100 TaxID=755731 RepID=UPI0002E0DFFD|nr:zinc ribbon domain-containing protein [Clostridium sp. BNL1100]